MGKNLVKVENFFASSQICNVCVDTKIHQLKTYLKTCDCPRWDTHHDRDVNAAINIRNEGTRIIKAYLTVQNCRTHGVSSLTLSSLVL